jgi:tripartite-type tricarboxylate transporter receptor subunit TctC
MPNSGKPEFGWGGERAESVARAIGRREFLAALAAAAACPRATFAQSTNYPSRSIKMLVPAPPAGITDLSARLVADGLRAKFGQPVIVENKPGANGALGLRELLRAAPDGYTVMVGTVGTSVIANAIDPGARETALAGAQATPFDPVRDMVGIAGTAEYATAMVVNKAMPVNSVQDFIDHAKARPGKLSFGSTGVGALDYVAAELFMRETGVRMVHVPYRGGPAALNDLMAGAIDVIIEVFPVVMEPIRSGLVKGLAVSTSYRLSSVPDLPTFTELGLPGVTLTGWGGVYGPPGLPEDIREKLGAAIVEVIAQPEIKEKFRAIGFEPMGLGVREFSALHASEIKRWVAFLTEIGLRK